VPLQYASARCEDVNFFKLNKIYNTDLCGKILN
jgi:hypothetical protein